MSAKILIIEDEPSIRRFISLNLSKKQYIVDEATDGEQGLLKAEAFLPALVILDIMLPGIDGLQVCKSLRAKFPDIGVLLLSAKGQDIDKITGLELGADDYMVKPFNPNELVARVKAILRRQTQTMVLEDNTLKSRGFELNKEFKWFKKNGKQVELTPREFMLIQLFMGNPGKAFSRNQLLNLLWSENYFGDTKIVDVNIRRLREKIEANPSVPIYLQTVWGYGYRWSGEGDE